MIDEAKSQCGAPEMANPKLQLECDKLQAEIEAIRRPFYQNPAFYSAIAPVVLAIVGLVITWSSGWFDVQRTRINNEKTLVEAQTERLVIRRDALETAAKSQSIQLEGMSNDVVNLRERERLLTNQLVLLRIEKSELHAANLLLAAQAKALASADEKAAEFLVQLQSAQSDRSVREARLAELEHTNALLVVQIGQLVEAMRAMRPESSLRKSFDDDLEEAFKQPHWNVMSPKSIWQKSPDHYRAEAELWASTNSESSRGILEAERVPRVPRIPRASRPP